MISLKYIALFFMPIQSSVGTPGQGVRSCTSHLGLNYVDHIIVSHSRSAVLRKRSIGSGVADFLVTVNQVLVHRMPHFDGLGGTVTVGALEDPCLIVIHVDLRSIRWRVAPIVPINSLSSLEDQADNRVSELLAVGVVDDTLDTGGFLVVEHSYAIGLAKQEVTLLGKADAAPLPGGA